MGKIEQLIADIEVRPLSETLPSVLEVALDCKDYHGYCVFFFFISPTSHNPKTNSICREGVNQTLLLHGLSKEFANRIVNESADAYLELKTISDGAVSSHGVKELEMLINKSEKALETMHNISKTNYCNLSDRIYDLKRMYESLRAYTLSKLSYYQQLSKSRISEKELPNKTKKFDETKIFVVHGHNGEIKEAVARMIEKQGLKAIILHEQTNQGDTIIEKIERNSDVGCAICLFTADDLGRAKLVSDETQRARQNVVFEAGYFIGKLGRKRVVLLADSEIEMPSDLQGVVYTDSSDWRFSVLKELKAIGYNIDYNKLDE